MPVLDTLTTKYVLDPAGYQRGAAAVRASTASTDASMRLGTRSVSAYGAALSRIVALANPVALAATAITGGVFAVVAANKAIAESSSELMQQAAEFDALVKSLEAVEGSAKRAHDQLRDLKELGKLPGIGFEEAIQGYVGLRRAGLGEAFSESILKELANQVALGGGGRDVFGRVLYAMKELANQPFLQGDELRQFTEAGLPAHRIVKGAFGTSDTEELKRQGISAQQVIEALVAAMAAMPRAGESALNTIENFKMGLEQAAVRAGSALNDRLLPHLGNFAAALERIVDGGVIEQVADSFAAVLSSWSLSTAGWESAMLNAAATLMTVADILTIFNEGLQALGERIGLIMPDLIGGVLGESVKDMWNRNRETVEMAMDVARRRAHRGDSAQGASPQPDTPGKPDKQTEYLRRIAEGVEAQLDLRRYGLGGGAGAIGLTAVDRTAATGVRGGQRLNRAFRELEAAVVESIATSVPKGLTAMRRAGMA